MAMNTRYKYSVSVDLQAYRHAPPLHNNNDYFVMFRANFKQILKLLNHPDDHRDPFILEVPVDIPHTVVPRPEYFFVHSPTTIRDLLSSVGVARHAAASLAPKISSSAWKLITTNLLCSSPRSVLPIILNVTAETPLLYDDSTDGEELVTEQMSPTVPAVRPASMEALKEVKIETLDANTTLTEEECSICLEEFSLCGLDRDGGGGDRWKIVQMPCSHVYHRDCIIQWLETSHECPLCRYAIPTHVD
ncbi:E3 ubiquitin-protein ligase RING1-like protein [Morus notabilis]|uniref:RING-type E3 ubiquitin transferase n=1 Tax=Morus notabilis TaxID=981085 RepID=W9RZF6_9ROSA|nr:uncharacterized protein LOC21408172 [Morus notabilis]EXC01103.1 E3 ubiquitin-protein ligase RING1-like protein [Morus notabilis]